MTQGLRCPVCSEPQFVSRVDTLDLPYFGEVIQFSMRCEGCGFRRVDVHVVNEKEPVRYELAVTEPQDLNARVVRSMSGHFEVVELGVRATPAEASDSFVSNVEGVLDRCIGAIESARNGAEDDTRAKAERLLERAERMRAGEEPFTIVVEDPLGNSLIVSDKAERRVLSQEEADRLGLPFVVLDAEDVRDLERT